MSLKHPRLYGSGRCRGGSKAPLTVREAIAAFRANRLIGQCGVCRRWFEVTKAGHIRPHINYDADRAEPSQERPMNTKKSIEPDLLSGREYCPRCGSGPRQRADTDECPDCGRPWDGPRLLDLLAPSQERP